MEKIILYSTGCPQCKVLETKLNAAGIQYVINNNELDMIALGFYSAPMLEAEGRFFTFPEAIKWLKEKQNNGN